MVEIRVGYELIYDCPQPDEGLWIHSAPECDPPDQHFVRGNFPCRLWQQFWQQFELRAGDWVTRLITGINLQATVQRRTFPSTT